MTPSKCGQFSGASLIRITKTVAGLLAVHLSGCVSLVTPADMRAVEPPRVLELQQPITFKFSSGLAVVREVSLSPGTYRAIGDDGKGIWFLGGPRSFSNTVLDRGGAFAFPENMIGVPVFSVAGLFVPHDEAQSPQVFVIYGDPSKVQAPANEQVLIGVTQTTIQTSPVLSSATPVQAGLGAGAAAAIVSSVIEADKRDWGKFMLLPWQPPDPQSLRKRFAILAVNK